MFWLRVQAAAGNGVGGFEPGGMEGGVGFAAGDDAADDYCTGMWS